MDSRTAPHRYAMSAQAGTDGKALRRGVPAGMTYVGGAREIYSVLGELGADAEQVVGEAGIDPRLLESPDNLVSVRALGALAQLCATRAVCPHFGLLAGQRATLASLGLVGALMESSATLGEALRALERHLRVQNRGVVPQLEVDGRIAVFTYSLYDLAGEGACHMLEGGLAATFQAIRQLCGAELALTEVLIPRRMPENAEPYRLLFRGALRFDQERAAFVFPAFWLEHSLPTADPILCGALEKTVVQIEEAAPEDLTDELRRLLRIELMKTRCSAAGIARLLSIHRRTANRHLKAEGTSFKTVADEIRYMVARQLLADTDLQLVQISAALDFSEPAAFTRAFRRWSGVAPSTWRAKGNSACSCSDGSTKEYYTFQV